MFYGRKERTDFWPIFASGIGSSVIFGLSFLFTKNALEYTNPMYFLFVPVFSRFRDDFSPESVGCNQSKGHTSLFSRICFAQSCSTGHVLHLRERWSLTVDIVRSWYPAFDNSDIRSYIPESFLGKTCRSSSVLSLDRATGNSSDNSREGSFNGRQCPWTHHSFR